MGDKKSVLTHTFQPKT